MRQRADRDKWLWMIVGVALLVRIALVLAHPFLFDDSDDYAGFARALLHGEYFYKGFYASRMPGYSAFLAACWAVLGETNRGALLVQAIFGAGCVLWVWELAKGMGRRTQLVAAGLMAVDPLSVAFSAALLSETLFTFFLLGVLTCVVRLGHKETQRKLWWWVALSVMWVAAMYLRPAVLWCLVPIGAWRLWMGWRGRAEGDLPRAWRFVGGLCVVYGLMLASLVPWLSRNYALFHTGYFRITTANGRFLYESLSPWTTGVPAAEKFATPADIAVLNEGQQADEFNRRAWEFARADPWRQVRMALVKMRRTWSPMLNAADFQSIAVRLLGALWHVPIFALGLIGMWRMWRQRWEWGVFMMPILYFTAVHAVYLGSVRYRVPLMPLVLLFAAVGVSWVADWGYGRFGSKPAVLQRV